MRANSSMLSRAELQSDTHGTKMGSKGLPQNKFIPCF